MQINLQQVLDNEPVLLSKFAIPIGAYWDIELHLVPDQNFITIDGNTHNLSLFNESHTLVLFGPFSLQEQGGLLQLYFDFVASEMIWFIPGIGYAFSPVIMLNQEHPFKEILGCYYYVHNGRELIFNLENTGTRIKDDGQLAYDVRIHQSGDPKYYSRGYYTYNSGTKVLHFQTESANYCSSSDPAPCTECSGSCSRRFQKARDRGKFNGVIGQDMYFYVYEYDTTSITVSPLVAPDDAPDPLTKTIIPKKSDCSFVNQPVIVTFDVENIVVPSMGNYNNLIMVVTTMKEHGSTFVNQRIYPSEEGDAPFTATTTAVENIQIEIPAADILTQPDVDYVVTFTFFDNTDTDGDGEGDGFEEYYIGSGFIGFNASEDPSTSDIYRYNLTGADFGKTIDLGILSY